jgi:hypothetical protein
MKKLLGSLSVLAALSLGGQALAVHQNQPVHTHSCMLSGVHWKAEGARFIFGNYKWTAENVELTCKSTLGLHTETRFVKMTLGGSFADLTIGFGKAEALGLNASVNLSGDIDSVYGKYLVAWGGATAVLGGNASLSAKSLVSDTVVEMGVELSEGFDFHVGFTKLKIEAMDEFVDNCDHDHHHPHQQQN